MMDRRRALMGAKQLPVEYQRVEYVGNSGDTASWIDTGILPTDTFGYKAKVSRTDVVSDKTLMQSRNGSGDTRITLGVDHSIIWSAWGAINQKQNVTVYTDIPFEVCFNYRNNRQITIDGASAITTNLPTLPYTPIYNFPLLGIRSSTGWVGTQIKIFEFEFTSGNNIVQKLIPCYRKADTAIGFFDVIGKTFYGNTGTGNLIKGADV